VTGEPVELLWVKGSGGDLGTLKPEGLAVLRLDRMRALVNVYPGVDREDEMVAAFDYCLHGKGGAAPRSTPRCTGSSTPRTSITCTPTPASRSRPPPTARRSRSDLRRQGRLGAVAPPGFQLGLDIAEIKAENPQAVG
jgi:rhamnulose-1-phosphate aldolase